MAWGRILVFSLALITAIGFIVWQAYRCVEFSEFLFWLIGKSR